MTDDDVAADFAADLSRLPLPRPSAARLHYAAGLAAGRRRAMAWQLATAAVAAVAVGLALARPPAQTVFVDRIVYAHTAGPTVAPLPEPDANSLLRLRQAMLSDATLPAPATVREVARHNAVIGAWMTEPPNTAD